MPTETPVIVNQEYLEDIADAIREKSGTVQTYTPADMAQAIADLPTGSSGYTLENIETLGSSKYSGNSNIRQFQWKGDIRKIAYLRYICNHSGQSSSTFHRAYLFYPYHLSQEFTYGQNIYIPVTELAFGGASSNTYAQTWNSGSNGFYSAVLKSALTASYGADDDTTFTAEIFGQNGQTQTTGYNGSYSWARMDITI